MPGGTGSNPFAQLIEDAEGLDKIEALQVGMGAGCVAGCATYGSVTDGLPHPRQRWYLQHFALLRWWPSQGGTMLTLLSSAELV